MGNISFVIGCIIFIFLTGIIIKVYLQIGIFLVITMYLGTALIMLIVFVIIFAFYKIKNREADIYFKRGNIKRDLRDYKGAIEDYTKVIELKPDYIGTLDTIEVVYLERGVLKELLEDYEGALADYDKTIELKPDFIDAYIYRGMLRCDLVDYRGAVKDYNKAVELISESKLQYMGEEGLENYEEVGSDSDKATEELDPLKEELEVNLMLASEVRGILFKGLVYCKKPMRYYNKVLKLDPKYVNGYLNRGVLKYHSGDYKGAIKDYNKVVELTSNLKHIKEIDLGNYRKVSSDSDKATEGLDLLKEELKIKILAAYKARGIEGKELVFAKDYSRYYNGFLNLDPTYEMNGDLYRGTLKFQSGDYKGAIKDYNKAEENGIGTDEIHYSRGIAKYKLEDYRGAIKDFDFFMGLSFEGREDVYKYREEAMEKIKVNKRRDE